MKKYKKIFYVVEDIVLKSMRVASYSVDNPEYGQKLYNELLELYPDIACYYDIVRSYIDIFLGLAMTTAELVEGINKHRYNK